MPGSDGSVERGTHGSDLGLLMIGEKKDVHVNVAAKVTSETLTHLPHKVRIVAGHGAKREYDLLRLRVVVCDASQVGALDVGTRVEDGEKVSFQATLNGAILLTDESDGSLNALFWRTLAL